MSEISAAVSAIGGLVLSGWPVCRYAPISLPPASWSTSTDRSRSGPENPCPPLAFARWQVPHLLAKTLRPRSTAAGSNARSRSTPGSMRGGCAAAGRTIPAERLKNAAARHTRRCDMAAYVAFDRGPVKRGAARFGTAKAVPYVRRTCGTQSPQRPRRKISRNSLRALRASRSNVVFLRAGELSCASQRQQQRRRRDERRDHREAHGQAAEILRERPPPSAGRGGAQAQD